MQTSIDYLSKQQLKNLYWNIALEKLTEFKKSDIENLICHVSRTSKLFELIAKRIKVKPSLIANAKAAVLLHDLGKLADNEIFALTNEPRKLSEQELRTVRSHPEKSLTILRDKKIYFQPGLEKAILYHHNPQGFSQDAYFLKHPDDKKIAEILIVSDYMDGCYDNNRAYHRNKIPASLKTNLRKLRKRWTNNINEAVYKTLEKLVKKSSAYYLAELEILNSTRQAAITKLENQISSLKSPSKKSA